MTLKKSDSAILGLKVSVQMLMGLFKDAVMGGGCDDGPFVGNCVNITVES